MDALLSTVNAMVAMNIKYIDDIERQWGKVSDALDFAKEDLEHLDCQLAQTRSWQTTKRDYARTAEAYKQYR